MGPGLDLSVGNGETGYLWKGKWTRDGGGMKERKGREEKTNQDMLYKFISFLQLMQSVCFANTY